MRMGFGVAVLSVITIVIMVTCQDEWPACIDIPKSVTLCRGIGYSKMRLPNLLGQDSVAEVAHQASSWLPLLNLDCHKDSRLFLCSLFSPVCLDRLIYPCRSLCQAVRKGCEGRMNAYGFSWPDMFHCDKFPIDNNMCIGLQSSRSNEGDNTSCFTCNQALTYENILDNYCRSDFVIRAKFRHVSKNKIICRKPKILKGQSSKLRQPMLTLDSSEQCCELKKSSRIFLVMGQYHEDRLLPSFIMPWQTKVSKPFKKAIRMFKKLNCSDPNTASISTLETVSTRTLNVLKKQRPANAKRKGGQKERKRKYRNTTVSTQGPSRRKVHFLLFVPNQEIHSSPQKQNI